MLTLFVLVFSACEQDRAFPEFADLEYGAYPRLIDGINGKYGTAFNFNDVAGSSIDFTVEFYDENDGKNVASYSWTVSYSGGTPVSIASVNASSFGTSPDGFPSASFEFTYQQVLDALGLTVGDVEGGKSFEFLATLTKTDCKVFTRDNTATVLQAQPAYKALFQIRVPIICPSELEGTYDFSTVSAGSPPSASWTSGVTTTGKIRFDLLGNGVYDIYTMPTGGLEFLDASMGAYWGGWGYDPTDAGSQGSMPNTGLTDNRVQIGDACSKLSFLGASQWGEVYSFNSITVNGSVLVLDWINDYGEGGVATITRTDGTNWPSNLRK